MSRILAKDAAKFSYVLPGGEHVPSVTTVLRLLAKKGLLYWAWEQGKRGMSLHEATDKPISIGRVAHYCIECDHKKEEPIFNGFREKEIEEGKQISERLSDLLKQHSGKIIASEVELTDAEDKYGGTVDALVETPNSLEHWDYKTSKQLYIGDYIQCMAYNKLLRKVGGYGNINPRLVLLTKDGRVYAPDISPAMQEYALRTWEYLLPCYHAYKKLEKEMNV